MIARFGVERRGRTLDAFALSTQLLALIDKTSLDTCHSKHQDPQANRPELFSTVVGKASFCSEQQSKSMER